jgi:hypothetical protein
MTARATAKMRAKRWNWRLASQEVGALEQYDFLYSYTSKLLHSTPLNIVSDKELSESEVIVMLDYAYVAVLDILDVISSTETPGAGNFVMIDLNE